MPTRNKLVLCCWAILTTPCWAQYQGLYFGQEPPGMTAQIFSPGFISLENRYEYGFALSPDGHQLLFMETNRNWDYFQILYTEMDDQGYWSEPEVPAFCQGYQNLYPAFSHDGQTLIFSSPRPSAPPYDVDLYTTQWTINGWSEPKKIPAPISGEGTREYRASVSQNSTLYYTCSGIWRATCIDGQYGNPELLPGKINGSGLTGSPFIAPDESYLIFESGRSGGYGLNDLYISFRSSDDSWQDPINLGPAINSEGIEDSGFITPDGKYFVFCRRAAYSTSEQTDISWINAATVLPDPNGPIENLTSGLRFGSLQCAINYAQDNDTLVLQPGIYQEPITLLAKDLIIRSIDPNDPVYVGGTILQGPSDGPLVSLTDNSSACELAGLTIRAGTLSLTGTRTQVTLRNCRFMDNTTHGIELFDESHPHLQHCLITANGQSGIVMNPIMQRSLKHCQPTLEDCVIVQNPAGSLVEIR